MTAGLVGAARGFDGYSFRASSDARDLGELRLIAREPRRVLEGAISIRLDASAASGPNTMARVFEYMPSVRTTMSKRCAVPLLKRTSTPLLSASCQVQQIAACVC
jgi:hypothetical protein